jgi:hypothetical protein
VFNQSKPGDTTITMAPRFSPSGEPAAGVRYLTTVDPGYVVIALSLANEGVLEAPTQEEKARVARQFSDGILKFISQAREHNITPIVASCYPRMSFTPVEYDFVEGMNLLINQWDVPSINLLGALDDGTGRYVREFDSDDRHPNAAGHKELFYTFVPSLFEALEKGKPRPVRPSAAGFAHAESGTALTFTPQDTVHSFAVSFAARTQANGTAAEIGGSRIGSSPSPFTAGVRVINGKWAYHAADGMDRLSQVSADGKWHEITVSHYAARGETLFFIDGMLAGRAPEKLSPARFTLGGDVAADYKDFMVFRSALNSLEASALNSGKLLQSSLEVFSPLTDASFTAGAIVENRAQSMSAVKIDKGRLSHVAQ